jgi:hypothetical protein
MRIYGYLLTHHAVSALICHAATDIDPDRVKFTRTVRVTAPTRGSPSVPGTCQAGPPAIVFGNLPSVA